MYIVIELQTTNGTTAVVPPVAYDNRNDAESKFHAVMSSAAVSSVEIHSCAVLDERGVAVLNGSYYHPLPAPEPETELNRGTEEKPGEAPEKEETPAEEMPEER